MDAAIKNRIAYLRGKADTLFSLAVYYVVLYEGFQTSQKLGGALAEFPKNPKKALADLRAHFSGQKQLVILGQHVSNAQAALLQKARSFILQVSDFLAVRMLDKGEAFRVLKRTLNFQPDKLELAKLKYDTFLDYYLPESPIECHRGHLRVDDYYVKVLTLKEPSAQSFPLIFKRLLEVEANYYVVTEWKKEDSGKMRRVIQSKRRHFHNTKRSFVSQVNMNDSAPQDVLLDDSKESQVRELGEGIKEIELHGNYFGQFSLTVVIYDLDVAKVERACADFYKVFSVHDAQLYEEKYNLLNAFLAAVPGNHVFNLRSLYLLNTNYADFSFLFTLHRGEPHNEHLRQEYLAVLETNHRTPYFLNLHYRDVAHTMILGRTGAGKSFLLNFLITNLQKYAPHTFIFDLGGSFESLTQLFGGSYVRVGLESEDFKINPFSLPPTKENLDFLALFLKVLIQGQRAASSTPPPSAISSIRSRTCMQWTPRCARLACWRIRSGMMLPAVSPNGPRGPVRIPLRQLRGHDLVLPLSVLRLPAHEPVPGTSGTAAFLHFASRQCRHCGPADFVRFQSLFHRRSVGVLEEPQHPAVRRRSPQDLAETQRRHGALHPISRRTKRSDILDVIIESCATKIFLANPDMDRDLYRRQFHLNENEVELISALIPKQQFLIKTPELAKVANLTRGSQELLALHERSLRQQKTEGGFRDLRL